MGVLEKSNIKMKRACTDIFCGADCLTKYEELKELDHDLTERGFSIWMAEQHKDLLEKMVEQTLSKEQMKALGESIRKKMEYAKEVGENLPPSPTPQEHKEIQENQEPRKHIATGEKPDGGAREGAGRKPKYLYTETFEVTHALDFAAIAISQLERINKDDPLREEALNEVQTWINNNRRKIQ